MRYLPLILGFLISLPVSLGACNPPTPPAPAILPTATAPPSPPIVAPVTISATPTVVPRQTVPPAPGPTHLVVWEGLPPAQALALAGDVDAFTSAYPQLTITVQHYDSPAEFLAAFQAGTVDFDLVLGPQALVAALQADDALLPLETLLTADFLENFIEPAKAGAQTDDQLWGLPATAGFHLLLFYNANLVDEPPATTQELFELAEKLTNRDQWGLAINSYDPLWIVPWLSAYGGWLTDEEGVPSLDSHAMEQALTLLLKWQGRLTGIAPVVTYDEARELFLDGKVGMIIDGEWAIGELKQVDDLPWVPALLPEVNAAAQPATPLVLARYWAVKRPIDDEATALQEREQAIVTFLEFMTDPQRQLQWTARFGLLPTHSNALADPDILNDPILRVSAQQLQSGRGVPLNVDADALLRAMRAPLRDMLNSQLTPREAAAAMQRAAE